MKDRMVVEVGNVNSVTIYTLLDDYAGYETSFYAQHGASFLLDARAKGAEKKILFDVGQSAQPILHSSKEAHDLQSWEELENP